MAEDDFRAERFVECGQLDLDRAVLDGLAGLRAAQHDFAAVVIRSVIALQHAQGHFVGEKFLQLARHVAGVDEQAVRGGRQRFGIHEFEIRQRMRRGFVEQRERMEDFQRRSGRHV